jgi:hypothetical protein
VSTGEARVQLASIMPHIQLASIVPHIQLASIHLDLPMPRLFFCFESAATISGWFDLTSSSPTYWSRKWVSLQSDGSRF